jgi:hypothetical protein
MMGDVMPSKRRALERDVRKYDKDLKSKSYDIYCRVLQIFLQSYPEEVRFKVLGLVRSKNFLELLSWADSYGGALHSTAAEAYAASQLVALIKKYPFPAASLKPLAFEKAIGKFLLAEKRCRRYNLKFRGANLYATFHLGSDLDRLKRRIAYVLGESPELSAIYDRGLISVYGECNFGPGASIGVHGRSTNLARKLLSEKWTCTPSALPYAVAAMTHDHHIYELLLSRPGGYVDMDPLRLRDAIVARTQLVRNNKIVTVPKTTLVDRTIAVEPLLNGYLQKGTDNYMRRLLKRVGTDLSDQGRNQHLARLGSLPNSKDPFVTIDLSLASDSISSALVRALLPPDWYHFLDAIRSPTYTLPGSPLDRRYEKFVSMGNGFCFPLETLIFASVCSLYSKPADFSVYGDDIVVRQSVAGKVVKTLWALGFRHNPDKTFLEGQFRESCGADWFAGRDIRPLTLDYEFDSLNSLIKFHNMSLSKPLWGLFFSEVREYIRELVPLEIRLQRPYKGSVYGAFEVPLDMFQSSNFSCWDRDIQAWSWYEIVLKGVPDRDVSKSERYPTLLTMAAVRGSLSSMPFAKRRITSQSIRRMSYAGSTSSWIPPEYR